MAGAGGGGGVVGSADRVARVERSEIRDSLSSLRPRVALRSLPHGWDRKFLLAERPEHSYTGKIAIKGVLPLTSGDRAV